MERLLIYIEETILYILPNLNNSEQTILKEYVYNICVLIFYKFDIDNVEKYIEKLRENNNRDIIATLFMLLPYIDDKNKYELFKKITKLNDILQFVHDYERDILFAKLLENNYIPLLDKIKDIISIILKLYALYTIYTDNSIDNKSTKVQENLN